MRGRTKRNERLRRRITYKRGGAVNRFPGVTAATTLEGFESEWDVIYIVAHGRLLADMFLIPQNTYMINTAPSTKVCTLDIQDERLNKLYEGHYEKDFIKFVKSPRETFEFIYDRMPIPGKIDDKTSIYEPLDGINDLELVFGSTVVAPQNMLKKGRTHFAYPGIFRVPISKQAEKYRKMEVNPFNHPKALAKTLLEMDAKFVTEDFNLIGPLIEKKKEAKFTLQELLSKPILRPRAGKKLLLILHTCRAIEDVPERFRAKVEANTRAESVERRRNYVPPPPKAPEPKPVAEPKPAGEAKPKAAATKTSTGFGGLKPGFLGGPPKKAPPPATKP